MTARPDPFRTHVADQVLAALAAAAGRCPPRQVQDDQYGMRYGQLIYNVLTRLCRR